MWPKDLDDFEPLTNDEEGLDTGDALYFAFKATS